MFGYVLPVKSEMKVRDFNTYRAFYCGLCKVLGKNYGFLSRFFLNYDLVFVALLADALAVEVGNFAAESCFANPTLKRLTLQKTVGLTLASDSLILLSWHKLQDDLFDESVFRRMVCSAISPAMYFMFRTAKKRQAFLSDIIAKQIKNQRLLEKNKCKILDEACEPTAQMCAAIFSAAASTSQQKKILARLGLFCGQIIYLLDAAEDFEKDIKRGRYNVFCEMNLSKSEAIETTKFRCKMAAGELALCYNLIETKWYKDILDNIIFLGLPQAISMAGTQTTKEKNHGQIDSI